LALPSPRKILVIRLSSLGDIILTFPLISKLKRANPKAVIDFAVRKEYSEAVELNKYISGILKYDNDLSGLRRDIIRNSYDVILDLQNNPKSTYLRMFNAPVIRRFRKDHLKKFMLVNGGINLYSEILPVFKKYIKTAEGLISKIDIGFEITDLEESYTRIPDSPYAVIAPSAKHFTKRYPVKKYCELIREFGDTIPVLVGSGSMIDMEVCGEIGACSGNAVNLCGRLSLRELVFLIRRSEIVVSNDSAVMHLAEAAGKRAAGIFGCTVREFGFFPQLEGSVVFENKGISCRPCSHIGLGECPRLTFDCMNKLNFSKEALQIN
jgi:heptosyltransferase-2